jgi:hypothetical protein
MAATGRSKHDVHGAVAKDKRISVPVLFKVDVAVSP